MLKMKSSDFSLAMVAVCDFLCVFLVFFVILENSKYKTLRKMLYFEIFGLFGARFGPNLTFLILGHFSGQNGLKSPKIFKISKIEKSTFFCIPMNLFHVNFEEKWTFQ